MWGASSIVCSISGWYNSSSRREYSSSGMILLRHLISRFRNCSNIAFGLQCIQFAIARSSDINSDRRLCGYLKRVVAGKSTFIPMSRIIRHVRRKLMAARKSSGQSSPCLSVRICLKISSIISAGKALSFAIICVILCRAY